MTELTGMERNTQRAELARKIVDLCMREHGELVDPDDIITSAVDIITDLLHLLRELTESKDAPLTHLHMAANHYTCELEEEEES